MLSLSAKETKSGTRLHSLQAMKTISQDMSQKIQELDRSEPASMDYEDDVPVEREPQHQHMPTRLYRKTGGILLDDEDEQEAVEEPHDDTQTSKDDFETELSCETLSDKECTWLVHLLMHGRKLWQKCFMFSPVQHIYRFCSPRAG
jgi:hypothetical protein